MKKTIVSLLLVFTMIFTFCACGGKTEDGTTQAEKSTENVTTNKLLPATATVYCDGEEMGKCEFLWSDTECEISVISGEPLCDGVWGGRYDSESRMLDILFMNMNGEEGVAIKYKMDDLDRVDDILWDGGDLVDLMYSSETNEIEKLYVEEEWFELEHNEEEKLYSYDSVESNDTYIGKIYYDEYNNYLKWEYIDSDGDVNCEFIYEYEYDDYGNIMKITKKAKEYYYEGENYTSRDVIYTIEFTLSDKPQTENWQNCVLYAAICDFGDLDPQYYLMSPIVKSK